MRKGIDLSVVIITWNQKNKLEQCLNSIFNQKSRCNFEVITIDNFSGDGTREMLQKFKDRVRLLHNNKNIGVAPARNQGVRIAKGKYIMMLDDDTTVHKNCFENIIAFMNKNSAIWCAGTKQLKPDGDLEYNARTFYNFPIILFRRTILGKFFPNNNFIKKHLMLDWDHNSPKEVDWVAGGSFIMRRSIIEKIGLFDEKYFFGFEDVDWCYRVWKSGGKVGYIHDAIITHHVQGSSKKMFSKKAFDHLKSALRFYYKTNHFKRMVQ